jgi:hypothetical protein
MAIFEVYSYIMMGLILLLILELLCLIVIIMIQEVKFETDKTKIINEALHGMDKYRNLPKPTKEER